ncbi:MAG: enoyl-CoA hydratase/isomerase family protein [Vulcanimicrobiaceae bacterium]
MTFLRVEREPAKFRATIVLDDPERHNTVPFAERKAFARLFDELAEDEAIRVIVVKGAGTEAFSAGGHIAQFLEQEPEALSDLAWNVGAPERCSKPVIAQLQGFTFGVGLEIALACDWRIAAEGTLLALPEIRLGMIPGSGGSQRIVRIAGLGRAKDMVMRGRRIKAAEALQWGLVTTVVPHAELDATVAALCDELAALPQPALRALKRVLGAAYDTPLHVAMDLEGREYARLRTTPDFIEGVTAFTNKRPPKFEQK